MSKGWIRLHRKIQDNWIWNDSEKLKAWLDILLMVNHEDKKTLVNGKLVVIHRGERLTSIAKLADRWGWSKQRVRNFLDLLEQDEMCTTNRTTNGTTLKVSNYAEYQDFQTGKKTANVTTDVTSDVTSDWTADVTSDVTQTIINNNTLNNSLKNEREGQAPHSRFVPSVDFVEEVCRKRGLKVNVQRFMAYYGARDWMLGKGMKVERPDQLEQLVVSWASDSVAEEEKKADSSDLTKTMPMYQEFSHSSMQVGVDQPFEGGLVQEMLKRKRTKKNAG